jgi:hypothetical protein
MCASAALSGHGNEVPPDSGATILDDYLRGRYRRVRNFGDYSISQKKLGDDAEGGGKGIHQKP